MDKSLAMLQNIGEFATLNSLGSIQKITEKLPDDMQRDWVRWSFRMLQDTDYQAKFPELVRFIRNEADEVNSLYGKILYSRPKRTEMTVSQPAFRKSTVLSTVAATQPAERLTDENCPFCKGSHRLPACKDFQQLQWFKRLAFLRRESCCFRCLKVGHKMSKCEVEQGCTVKDRKDPKHHTLLHRFAETRSVKDCSVLCAATEGTRKLVRPYFMTIPVKIRCGEKEVTSYALLDSGSQRTFLQESLAKRLNVRGKKQSVSIRTLSSRSNEEVMDSQAVTIKVAGLYEDENRGVELKDVLTVLRLPMKATPLPTCGEIWNMKHLSGIRFTELQDKSVGLLIGLDFRISTARSRLHCKSAVEKDVLASTVLAIMNGINKCFYDFTVVS